MSRTHILDEIRRTGDANGGVPLGSRKFSSETGITESDWKVYWARWSEPVREAGFAPNQLTGAYESAKLLEKYKQLSLELHRLPTHADMRLKARKDPEFPHDRPFRRFGTRREFILQVLDYCRNRDGCDDVNRWCEEYLARERGAPEPVAPEDENIGFVYLLKSGRSYKIGRSNAPGRREYELAIQLPEKLKTLHVIRTDDPNGIEAYWHKRFATKCKNGEWFDLNAADVAAFKRRKFM